MVPGATGERSITEQGFQFLLLDTYGQLWLLLREYIASANARFGAPADHCCPQGLQQRAPVTITVP